MFAANILLSQKLHGNFLDLPFFSLQTMFKLPYYCEDDLIQYPISSFDIVTVAMILLAYYSTFALHTVALIHFEDSRRQ
jgi:hypothetical protein